MIGELLLLLSGKMVWDGYWKRRESNEIVRICDEMIAELDRQDAENERQDEPERTPAEILHLIPGGKK